MNRKIIIETFSMPRSQRHEALIKYFLESGLSREEFISEFFYQSIKYFQKNPAENIKEFYEDVVIATGNREPKDN